MSVPPASTAAARNDEGSGSFFSSLRKRRRASVSPADAARARRSLSRAAGAAVEWLEDRTLFTTIGANAAFTYQDLDSKIITIRTGPGVIAELVGYSLGGALGNLRPIGQGQPNDLYAIYVSQSNANSWISVVANRIDPGQPTQHPFQEAIADLNITDTEGFTFRGTAPVITAANAGTGNAYLGGREPVTPNPTFPLAAPYRPIFDQQVGALGVIPGAADVTAGFYVANDNDFGRFIFDGTVTGRVNATGNLDTFYAGWILTGETTGIPGPNNGPSISIPNNFNVDGDLRNLVSVGPFGTTDDRPELGGNPRYNTGFDLQVGGRLGQVTTRSQFQGKLEVVNALDSVNDPNNLGIRNEPFRELEWIILPDPPGPAALDDLISDPDARNDTFNTPQILGSYLEDVPGLGRQYVSSVNGTLQTGPPTQDPADYYGISLMAGQKIVVDLNAGFDTDGDGRISADEESLAGNINIGLFDPDGRLVATDYAVVSASEFGAPFGYTADRPGLYRLAVASNGNTDFVDVGLNVGVVTYTIDVRGVGDLAFGGMLAGGRVTPLTSADPDADPANPNNTTEAAIRARRGDFGSILSAAEIKPDYAADTFASDNGDLRSIEANQVGFLSGTLFSTIGVEVPNGSIGLISSASTDRTAGTGNLLGVSTVVDDQFLPIPIGGNIQLMSAGGQFFGDLRVNGGIGVIRAGNIGAQTTFPVLFVDYDRNGGGFIDLIDCVNDFGTLTGGGPAIDTGLSGNVRYIQVGGQVFSDDFFHSGSLQATRFGPGEVATIVDDSGSRVSLTPVRNTAVAGAFDPSLSVLAYPIRSGGSVIIDVTSTGSFTASAAGGNVAEISRVEIQGTGRAVGNLSDTATPAPPVTSQDRGDPVLDRLVTPAATAGTDLSALFTGGVTIDVLNVVATRSSNISEIANATAIRNETPRGEIVNITVESVVDLFADGPLGLPKNQSGAAIVRYQPMSIGNDFQNPRPLRPVLLPSTSATLVGNLFPFLGQTTGIVASGGNILNLTSNMGIGNVMVHGSIGTVTANADRKDDGEFEGINAPVVAFNFNSNPPDLNGRGGLSDTRLAGRILNVNIGDGILPSGSGNLSFAGLYGDRPIGTIENQGLESDIRGNVVSRAAIDRISLNNGAIIGSSIVVFGSFEGSSALAGPVVVPNTSGSLSDVDYEIGGIDLTGRGGILSSLIVAADIGLIKIDGGFGFIGSTLNTVSSTRVEGIQTDGYGIRNGFIETGASGGIISARGDGSSVSVTKFTPSVQYSKQLAADPFFLDPFFGTPPSLRSDLYLAIGTTPDAPEVAGTTDTGVIEDMDITGTGNLSSISAFTIRAGDNGVPILRDPTIPPLLDPTSDREFEPMRISVGNGIGTLVTRGPINGLFLSTGRIGTFAPNGDLFNTDITISGPIGLMKIAGDFAETSHLFASGPNGRIKKLQILGDLIGDITSDGKIGDVSVTGLVDGAITSRVAGGRTQAINSITIGGVTPDGHLTVVGNLGKLTVNGDLGTAGDVNNQVNITGSAKTIRINGNLETNLTVSESLNTLDVRGSIVTSNVTVTDTLKTLKVAGNVEADSTVTARVIKKQAIKGGVSGQIVVTG